MITKSTASPEQPDSNSDSGNDNHHYLSKYVDNPRISKKKYELRNSISQVRPS